MLLLVGAFCKESTVCVLKLKTVSDAGPLTGSVVRLHLQMEHCAPSEGHSLSHNQPPHQVGNLTWAANVGTHARSSQLQLSLLESKFCRWNTQRKKSHSVGRSNQTAVQAVHPRQSLRCFLNAVNLGSGRPSDTSLFPR